MSLALTERGVCGRLRIEKFLKKEKGVPNYLLAFECEPVKLDQKFNGKIPKHVTLVYWFYTAVTFARLARSLEKMFTGTPSITLEFDKFECIGIDRWPAFLIKKTPELMALHADICKVLDKLGVTYHMPNFVQEHFCPHMSAIDATYEMPSVLSGSCVYLLKKITSDSRDAFVCHKFYLKT